MLQHVGQLPAGGGGGHGGPVIAEVVHGHVEGGAVFLGVQIQHGLGAVVAGLVAPPGDVQVRLGQGRGAQQADDQRQRDGQGQFLHVPFLPFMGSIMCAAGLRLSLFG